MTTQAPKEDTLASIEKMVDNPLPNESTPKVRSTVERPTGLTRKRKTLSSTKLGVDVSRLQAAGWYCHWINDDGGRIQDMIDIGYLFVPTHEIGDGSASTFGTLSADGSDRVCRRVGVKEDGKELLAYLMKTSLEFHEENMAATQLQPDRIDAQIRSGVIRTPVGEPSAEAGVDPESKSHFYRDTKYNPVTRYR